MKKIKQLLQLLLTLFPSALKVPLYRLLGARIKPRAKIGIGVVLVAEEIELGPGARIKPLSIIAGLKRLQLGAHAQIASFCLIHGTASLLIKPRGGIGVGCLVDLHADVLIGEYSSPGPRCTFMTHGTFWPAAWGATVKRAPIILGDMVWIGFGCKILPGVEICDRTVILPNSTIGTNVRTSGVIIDNLAKRTTLPFETVQRAVSRAWLKQHLHELITVYFTEVLEGAGYSLTPAGTGFHLRRGGRQIVIHCEPPAELPRPTPRQEHWLIGFDLSTEWLLNNTRCQVLDVRQALHSPRPSRAFRRALAFFSTNFGVRAADARDRHHFQLPLPELVDEEPSRAVA